MLLCGNDDKENRSDNEVDGQAQMVESQVMGEVNHQKEPLVVDEGIELIGKSLNNLSIAADDPKAKQEAESLTRAQKREDHL